MFSLKKKKRKKKGVQEGELMFELLSCLLPSAPLGEGLDIYPCSDGAAVACFHVEGILLLLRYSPGETLDLLRRGKDRKKEGGEGREREREQEYVYTPLSVFLLWCFVIYCNGAFAPASMM